MLRPGVQWAACPLESSESISGVYSTHHVQGLCHNTDRPELAVEHFRELNIVN